MVRVTQILTMHLGPEFVVLALKVAFEPTLSVDAVESTINEIERRIREEQPRMMKIFVEPDSHGDLRGVLPEKATGSRSRRAPSRGRRRRPPRRADGAPPRAARGALGPGRLRPRARRSGLRRRRARRQELQRRRLRGISCAARELGVTTEVLEPSGAEDREAAMRLFAARGFDLVIGVGFIFSTDVDVVATAFPKTSFACIDYSRAPTA